MGVDRFEFRLTANPCEAVEARSWSAVFYWSVTTTTKHCIVFFSVCLKALNESIADVKTNCVECFESVALCEQLHRADNDPAIRTLLQQRPLDPFLDSLLKSIRSQQAYVDREMTKADAVLDDQWQEYQSQRLNKRYLL